MTDLFESQLTEALHRRADERHTPAPSLADLHHRAQSNPAGFVSPSPGRGPRLLLAGVFAAVVVVTAIGTGLLLADGEPSQLVDSADQPVTSPDPTTRTSPDPTTDIPPTTPAPTSEGDNTYVDDFGILRDAGTDEPTCPQPPPPSGQLPNGEAIRYDGTTGKPLCGPNGDFLTMPPNHQDSDPTTDGPPTTPAPTTGTSPDPTTDIPPTTPALTGEGDNTYVDDFGILRDAGTDEPTCPQPPPPSGQLPNGEAIRYDGTTGKPLCGPNGDFLTMPPNHQDSEG